MVGFCKTNQLRIKSQERSVVARFTQGKHYDNALCVPEEHLVGRKICFYHEGVP